MMSTPQEIETVPTQPEPFMKGTFALYELPDGGRMLAYRQEGQEETSRVIIPAAMIRVIEAQSRGESINPLTMMKTFFGK